MSNRSKLIVYKKTTDGLVLNPTFQNNFTWHTTNRFHVDSVNHYAYNTLDVAVQSRLSQTVSIADTSSLADRFYDNFWCTWAGGYVGFLVATPTHGYEVGDWVEVKQDAGALVPAYSGVWQVMKCDIVVNVNGIDYLQVETNCPFISNTPVNGGNIARVTRGGGLYRLEVNVDELNGYLRLEFGGNSKTVSVAGKYLLDFWINSFTEIRITALANCVCKISQVQLYELNTFEVDLYDEEEIEITYQLMDIQNIFQRKSDYSKNITIPNTPSNQVFFEHAYDISSVGAFEFNRQFDCKVYYDDLEVFDGYFELDSITRIDDTDKIEYNGNIFSTLKYFIDKLGDAKLSGNDNPSYDVDLSIYDHTLTMDNIRDSWTYKIHKNGNEIQNTTPGDGYVYAHIDNGNADKVVDINELVPSIYIKTILDNIFTKHGITYNSNFLNSAMFKKLIYLRQDIERISDAEKSLREMIVINGSSPNGTVGSTSVTKAFQGNNLRLNVKVKDDYNAYDTSLYKWTCPKSGKYSIDLFTTIQGRVFNILNSGFGMYVMGPYGTGTGPSIGHWAVLCSLQIRKNGNVIYGDMVAEYDWGMSTGAGSYIDGSFMFPNEIRYQTKTLSTHIYKEPFVYGDVVEIRMVADCYTYQWMKADLDKNSMGDKAIANYDFSLIGLTQNDNVFRIYADGDNRLTVGDTVDLNVRLDKTQSQSSFVSDIFKMFNLFVYQDKLNPKVLNIEPYNDFWGTTSVINNWTYKRDQASEFVIEDASDLRYKNIYFSYTTDEDYLNTTYKLDNGEKVWGEYNYVIDAAFKDTYKLELGFASTPCVNFLNYTNSVVIPSLVFSENGVGVNPDAVSKPRILFYNGLVNNGTSYAILENTTYNNIYNKPFVSHFEDLEGDTGLDLNWDTCDVYYQRNVNGNAGVTTGNLFNTYYQRYVEELLDPDTKKITCWVNLNEVDIHNFKFNDKIEMDGIYFRVLSIEDFNPNKLTKVVMVKIKEPTLKINKKKGFREWDWYIGQPYVSIGRENYLYNTAIINGNNNTVQPYLLDDFRTGARNITLLGNNNKVSSSNTNIFAFGDNNTDMPSSSFNVVADHINLITPNLKLVDTSPNFSRPVYLDEDGKMVMGRANIIHVIDGNYDQFNPIVNVHIIDGGLDTVRGFNSVNNIYVVDDTIDRDITYTKSTYE